MRRLESISQILTCLSMSQGEVAAEAPNDGGVAVAGPNNGQSSSSQKRVYHLDNNLYRNRLANHPVDSTVELVILTAVNLSLGTLMDSCYQQLTLLMYGTLLRSQLFLADDKQSYQ